MTSDQQSEPMSKPKDRPASASGLTRSRIRRVLFTPRGDADAIHLTDILRHETVGGFLMLAAAVVALLWANIAPSSYSSAAHAHLGPMTLAHWTADGLLVIFFFVAGLELKREFAEGALSRPRDALVPIVAAMGGMIIPAGLYLLVNGLMDGGLAHGWPIPMATDIAFALAVLAIAGSRLPTGVRAFLLTLAIVDDLGSIIVIAALFTGGIAVWWLLGALAGAAVWWTLQKIRFDNGLVYIALFIATWWCMYQSGIHATIAGVILGLLTRTSESEMNDPVDRWQHRVQPWSAGLVVPLFALFAAGVSLTPDALKAVWTNPVPLGIMAGLVIGKIIGIFGGARLTAKITNAELGDGVVWRDVLAVSAVAGIGFTVSMLMSELAFRDNPELAQEAKTGVLIASLLAAVLGAWALRRRTRAHASDD